MVAYADLHLHTLYSDGKLTPAELLEKAKNTGLSAISITDHDSIEGCLIAQEIKKDYSVEVLNGIELSCYEDGKEYHILGYNIDLDNQMLLNYLGIFREGRLKRAERILQKLKNINIPINFDHILEKAGAAPITRPHIASVMMDLGYTSTLKEAFLLYLGEGRPAYESKIQMPLERAIKVINQSGGVAVLAHPGRFLTPEILFRMIEKGIDGIEVIHPMHDKDLQKFYHAIASQYWLLETGGSDYHGTRDYDEANFGKFVVPASIVDSVKYHSVKK